MFRSRKRKALARQPFPDAWSDIIAKNVPYCRRLQANERSRLEHLIQVFISEKNFEGCAGLVITDEIRITIAAQASLLLLNLKHNYYERLITILVYPGSFKFEKIERGVANTIASATVPVSGVSSSMGVIALSWPETAHDAQNPDDGVNVVLHEFAHQLDLLDSTMNGAPILNCRSLYRKWAQVLGTAFNKLQSDVAEGIPSLISPYGATKPAEFFAVVTELFFEKPLELQQEYPILYEKFRQYYGQDPAKRLHQQSCRYF